MLYKNLFPNVLIQGATPSLLKGIRSRVMTVLWLENAPWDAHLDLILVSSQKMQSINHLTRGLCKPTDALTFSEVNETNQTINEILFSSTKRACTGNDDAQAPSPALLYTHAMKPDPLQARRAIRDELVDLGTIYFCVEYIWHRTMRRPQKNLPLELYLEAALVHALLHVLGYTHETDEALWRMIRREKCLGYHLRSLQRKYPLDMPRFDAIEYMKAISHG
ncbi:unnamed protein product [Phytomonas sp. EM1]|nr:unnamed protein product [Phytomonas sp. EM1]|eukprot:CCW60730.1 unnamed protein product [Phytomonas sp. isolate EM1]